MSDQYSTIKNKHPKLFFKQYLYNLGEPWDDISNDTPPELEAELLENSSIMRGRVKRYAKSMRNRLSR